MTNVSLRYRSRLSLTFTAASFAALAVSFSLAPGLSMRSAEGCSGAGPSDCSGPTGWKSFEILTNGAAVPTDGGILLRAVSSHALCTGSPDPIALRAEAVVGETKVAGSVVIVEGPTSSTPTFARESTYTLLWKPSTPLTANTAYTLAIDAPLAGGAGGAAGASGGAGVGGAAGAGGGVGEGTSLGFSTASGALGALAPPAGLAATSAAKKVTTSVCCSVQRSIPAGSGCPMTTQDCVDAVERERPELTLTFSPSAAEADRPYLDYAVYEVGGDPASPLATAKGRELTAPFTFQRTFDDGARHCLRVETRHLTTGQVLSTDAPCPEPAAVVPAVTAHCADLTRVVAACDEPGGAGVFKSVSNNGRELLTTYCAAAGSGGSGGSGPGGSGPGGSGPGGSGGSPPGNGGTPDSSGDDDGCHMQGALGAPSTFWRTGVLAAVGALVALRRLARRRA
ncbi:MAG TPA: hypothetical protein VFS00_08960 [Polyangiaceae bacterium]|nr:hypothetical protein [Polyangiaceae bacterium]